MGFYSHTIPDLAHAIDRRLHAHGLITEDQIGKDAEPEPEADGQHAEQGAQSNQ